MLIIRNLMLENKTKEETVFLVCRITMRNLRSILKGWKMHHDNLIYSIDAQNTDNDESADMILPYMPRGLFR